MSQLELESPITQSMTPYAQIEEEELQTCDTLVEPPKHQMMTKAQTEIFKLRDLSQDSTCSVHQRKITSAYSLQLQMQSKIPSRNQ